MPSLSPTMTEGNLTKWFIKKGDQIKAGDLIAEVETDKATMEVEAVDEGIVKELLFKDGDESIAVNTPIAILVTENEDLTDQSNIKDIAEIKQQPSLKKNINKKTHIKKEQKTSIQPDEKNLITMRQAIRDAISEEMRKNDKVFVIGEEVGEYQGAYKVTQGLLEEFGDKRIIDTPIS